MHIEFSHTVNEGLYLWGAQLEAGASAPDDTKVQLTMFTPLSQKIVDALRAADLNRLTPLDAMNLLAELKQQLD